MYINNIKNTLKSYTVRKPCESTNTHNPHHETTYLYFKSIITCPRIQTHLQKITNANLSTIKKEKNIIIIHFCCHFIHLSISNNIHNMTR